jgi:uncharacterized YccA/Bax inhibitor family protein
LFTNTVPLLNDSSPIGIGISVVIVIIAALNLVVDFDFIEQGVAKKAPKYMEWYSSFGLFITIVWLYIENSKAPLKKYVASSDKYLLLGTIFANVFIHI